MKNLTRIRKNIPIHQSHVLKMKLSVVLFFFMIIQVNANLTYGQKDKVSVNLQNVNLDRVLTAIESQTDYRFIYKDDEIDYKKSVSIKVEKSPIKEVLQDLFRNTSIDYQVVGTQIILKPNKHIKTEVLTQKTTIVQVSVNGSVLDDNGQPLPGASILEKGTTNGATTDFDGNFSLTLTNSDAVLVVSYIGFVAKEVAVNGNENITVTLEEDFAKLDEVVVIGYGQQSKAKVIGSVGKIEEEELSKVASSSVGQQLAGKMSGVVVNQSNGQPGAASQIVIRGTGTLTAGTNPLIVVDGFPLSEGSSLNSINPDDIATVNVLKDAASASIYGSRAANGVILVTTKQGSKNEKTTITLDTYVGMQEQSSGVELVDAYQFAQFITEARNWGYVSKDPANRSATDPNSVRVTKTINGQGIDGRELYLDFLQPYLDGKSGLTNTDWMDVAFRAAAMYNYNLSVSGGNEKTKFYTSLGYFNQEGIVIGSDLKRYSANINLNSKLTDKINIGVSVKPSFTDQNALDQGSRSSGAIALVPLNFSYYSPYTDNGDINISEQIINEQREIEGVRINGTPVENLLATSTMVKDNRQQFRVFGNVFADFEIVKNLKYKISLGGDYENYTRNFYYPSSVGSYRTPAPRSDAEATQDKQTRYNYLIENTLNYDFSLAKHNFDLLAGYTFQKENIDFSSTVGTGFADDNIKNIAGASSHTTNYNLAIWALESYFTRLQYDYDAKYLFSAAIRKDGSSRFGSNNRWGYFPSVSGGWVFTRESFMPLEDIVTFGKISASWGQTGNNQIGNYGSYALVTDSNYVNGNSLAAGYITTSAPNPNLGWEVASAMNIGLDLSFFHKLNFSMAYYKTNTKDLLLNVPVPQQTGYENVLANIGEMENKGLEFELSGRNFMLGNVGLGFNANLTSYQNKVLALGPGQEEIATGRDQLFVTKVGGSIAEIYGYEVDGVFKTQQEIDNTPHLSGTLTGDFKVKDINGDGKINDEDKVSKGTYTPDFTYGFGGSVAYKGFNFSFNFNGVSGRTLMDGDMASLTEAGEGFSVPTTYYFENRYHPVNNPDGFLGQPNFGNFSNSRKILRSSVVVEENNGDYIRLRDIRIAYDFSKSILERLRLSKLQLYVSGNNVFTKTDYRGWNPDGTSSNILTSGYNDGSNYPLAKTYLVGLRIAY
ncbi:TonB-dependent receptor [Galbibacter orientalis]|uniref:TonB-dependent receptor n=1 Tax=Galbibacter orientalis TaxID=453852 RepID=UPI00307FDD17